ncbi:hypothetical protein OSB04_015739 [Centaurea solstitialis]|uniref:F-box domain-containing protein n=1 Tax=Centaurea solstitialis TaxID=347529 RepID=A0AA38T183_9ASTR|nr:hypothetical protein OSB04_015739 [Centaurea solstitialis]
MDDLPRDVMADILTRLPIMTIISCKCVCKKWQNLVLDSYFVNLHLSRSPPSLIVRCISRLDMRYPYKPGTLKWVEIEDKPNRHHLHHDPVMSLDLNLSSILQNSKVILRGSVNGLLCLSQSVGHGGDNACICNPITKEYMILHQREDTWTFICGFGVVSTTGEYKVIRTFQDSNPTSLPRELEAEVYTLGTGQWRNIGHVPYSFDHSDQPFLNDHIHWRVDDEDSPESLCSFDLDKETFQLFPSPPSEAIEESYMHFQSLAILKGCLCKSDTYDSQYTIWVMKEYGIKESWHKEVVVKLGIIPDLDWLIWEPMFLIEGLKDGSILMDYRHERLFVYCPQSKTIEHTEIFDPYFTGLAYRPSFLKLRDFISERVYIFTQAILLQIEFSSYRLRLGVGENPTQVRIRGTLTMEDLLTELTIDILSRLPVKTIICCKLVCRKWRNLVLDSSFVDLHHSRSPTSLIIHDLRDDRDPGIFRLVEIEDEVDHHHLHDDPLMSLDLNMVPIFQNSKISLKGSVNGLICLHQYARSRKVNNTYICNPITREYMILPRQQRYTNGSTEIVYGFGVSSQREYKVVRTFQKTLKPSVVEAEMYTLGTGQWRSLGRVPYLLYGLYGRFLNGHCHWTASDPEDARDAPLKICTFDLDKETFQLFPSPPIESVQEDQINFQNLAVLKGFLYEIDTYSSRVIIWVMKEYGIKKSWHKEVVIPQVTIDDIEWPLWAPISPIEVFKDGSILIVFEDELWEFYPQSGAVEDTEMFDLDSSGMAYRPSFLKLQNFESERVLML